MVQKQRGEYLSLRREFEPTTVTLVIVAESPPASGKYFYNPDGEVSEPLFNALMKQLGIQPKTKFEGLREFQKRGWVLVDATYEPRQARPRSRDRSGLPGALRRPQAVAGYPLERSPASLDQGERVQAAGAKVEGRRVQCAQQGSDRLLSQPRTPA